MKVTTIWRIALGTVGILMIPLIGTLTTDEVAWDPFDFIVAGVLLFGMGLLINLVWQKVRERNYRIATIVVLVLAFMYVWAELAVGIFTNWGS